MTHDRQEYCFNALLKLAGLPRSTYYYILKQLGKPKKHEALRAEIHQICREQFGRYGYRRVTIELRKRGVIANHKLVMRLMKEDGLTSRVRMKKYRSYRGETGKIAPDLVKRNFHTEWPNQKWTTDITEFSLFGEKLYRSPVLDMFNGEIVTYTISDRPVLKQVTDMVEAAFNRLPESFDLIFHSDQGWQYQHKAYQKMLSNRGAQQSMSRKGNCLENSVMENFFGLLKSELLYLQTFESMDHFREELVTYIEYYNNKRIKGNLKASPVEYRTRFFDVA